MKHRLRKDNRGITLVEVIVSMLILALIVIPLLSSFVLSSRVNLKSRNKQYATVLGQNVMEGIKNYDLEQIALQFNGISASPDEFLIVPKTSLVDDRYGFGYYETDEYLHKLSIDDPADQDKISVARKETGEAYFKGLNDKYYYTLTAVKEGSRHYDVRITISAQNYQGSVTSGSAIQQNQFQLPDVTKLDRSETAIINPSSIGIQYLLNDKDYKVNYHDDSYDLTSDSLDNTLDYAALNYFYHEHEIYQYYADLEAKASLDIPTPTSPPKLSKDELQKKISKKTIITISDKEVEGKNKILVSTKLEYKLNDGENILYAKGAADVSKAIKQYGGFYEQVAFDQLEQIYLFHTPLVRNAWDSNGDQIIIDNQSKCLGSDLKVFIAQQRIIGGADGGYGFIEPIQVEARGESQASVKFYYDSSLSKEPLISADDTYDLSSGTNYFETLVTYGAAKDRIYEVEVQVYEAGFTELLYEINSTITR